MVTKCYEMRKSIFGERHADTLASLYHLCKLNKTTTSFYDNYHRFARDLKHCYETQKLVLGSNHSDTLTTLIDLADNIYYSGSMESNRFGSRGVIETALGLYIQCYEARRAALGHYHPDTLIGLSLCLSLSYAHSLNIPIYVQLMQELPKLKMI